MGLAENIASDYLIFDDLETVVVRSVRTSGDVLQSVTGAMRTQSKMNEASAASGKNVETSIVWTLPTLLLPFRPKPSDELEDADGVNWIVLMVDEASQRSRFRLSCIDLILTFNLRDRVSIWRATASIDEYMGRTITRVLWKPNLPASINLTNEYMGSQRDKRGTIREFSIVLQSRVPLEIEDQIRDDAGRIFSIKSLSNSGEIDSLWTVTAEQQR